MSVIHAALQTVCSASATGWVGKQHCIQMVHCCEGLAAMASKHNSAGHQDLLPAVHGRQLTPSALPRQVWPQDSLLVLPRDPAVEPVLQIPLLAAEQHGRPAEDVQAACSWHAVSCHPARLSSPTKYHSLWPAACSMAENYHLGMPCAWEMRQQCHQLSASG